MISRRWLPGVLLRRAAGAAGLAAFALALPLAVVAAALPGDGRWPPLGLGSLYVGLFAALPGALRLRPAAGERAARLWHELVGGLAVVGAVWAAASLAQLLGAFWLLARGPGISVEALTLTAAAPVMGALSAAAAGASYALCRAIVLAWGAWGRLRRSRLLWALTHAQLVAGLILAVGAAAVLTTLSAAAMLREAPRPSPWAIGPAPGAADLVNLIVLGVLPTATALLVLSVAAAVAVLPPAALISYVVLRRTTRRLEALAGAAEALRGADLASRTQVEGEDEVARLQTTFNLMAGDLQRTVGELEAERDRVARLLEANRELVAAASHELRTPVANVRGYLESALERGTETPGLREDLETMEQELARLQRLIDDLFGLSRAAVGRLDLRPEPTDAGATVRRLVETATPIAWRQRRVQVSAEVETDLPPARADRHRLEQIVSNLLTNAVRHTPPGGLVVAVARGEPGGVLIEVRDTGQGIAAEELPRVFERFYRGRSDDGHGAGLGLALVKELAEAMGGSVEASSTPGEGSRFTVRLPAA